MNQNTTLSKILFNYNLDENLKNSLENQETFFKDFLELTTPSKNNSIESIEYNNSIFLYLLNHSNNTHKKEREFLNTLIIISNNNLLHFLYSNLEKINNIENLLITYCFVLNQEENNIIYHNNQEKLTYTKIKQIISTKLEEKLFNTNLKINKYLYDFLFIYCLAENKNIQYILINKLESNSTSNYSEIQFTSAFFKHKLNIHSNTTTLITSSIKNKYISIDIDKYLLNNNNKDTYVLEYIINKTFSSSEMLFHDNNIKIIENFLDINQKNLLHIFNEPLKYVGLIRLFIRTTFKVQNLAEELLENKVLDLLAETKSEKETIDILTNYVITKEVEKTNYFNHKLIQSKSSNTNLIDIEVNNSMTLKEKLDFLENVITYNNCSPSGFHVEKTNSFLYFILTNINHFEELKEYPKIKELIFLTYIKQFKEYKSLTNLNRFNFDKGEGTDLIILINKFTEDYYFKATFHHYNINTIKSNNFTLEVIFLIFAIYEEKFTTNDYISLILETFNHDLTKVIEIALLSKEEYFYNLHKEYVVIFRGEQYKTFINFLFSSLIKIVKNNPNNNSSFEIHTIFKLFKLFKYQYELIENNIDFQEYITNIDNKEIIIKETLQINDFDIFLYLFNNNKISKNEYLLYISNILNQPTNISNPFNFKIKKHLPFFYELTQDSFDNELLPFLNNNITPLPQFRILFSYYRNDVIIKNNDNKDEPKNINIIFNIPTKSLDKTNNLKENCYIFDLFYENADIILSDYNILKKLVSDSNNLLFFKNMLNYDKKMLSLLNIIFVVAQKLKIDIDKEISEEFFYLQTKKVEDIF
jgi:hypothetical protein